MAVTIGELVAKITANTRRFDRAFKDVEKRIGATNKSAARLTAGFKAMGRSAAVAATGVALGTVALGKFAQQGGKILAVQQAFARRVGDSDRAVRGLTRATSSLISRQELMVGFNQAVTLGAAKTTEEFGKMAEAALVLGRTLGVDAAFALESMTLGIGRQSRQILDNLGLIVRVEEANKRYANSLDVTTASLDDNQRREAFRIEALRQINAAVGELGDITLNTGDAWTQLTVEIGNALDRLKLFVAESDKIRDFFEALRRQTAARTGGPGIAAQGIIEGFAGLTEQGVKQRLAFFDALEERMRAADARLTQTLNNLARSSRRGIVLERAQSSARIAHANTTATLRAEFDELGISMDDLTNQILPALTSMLDGVTRATEDAGEAAKTTSERIAELVAAADLTRGGAGRLGGGPSIFFQGATGAGGRIDRSQKARDELAAGMQKIADNFRALEVPLKKTPGLLERFTAAVAQGVRGISLSGILGVAAGNVVGGAFNAAISGIGGLLGGLFSKNFDQVRDNTEALRRNTDAILSALRAASGAALGGAQAALEAFRGTGAVRTIDEVFRSMEALNEALQRAGIDFVVTLSTTAAELDQLGILLGNVFADFAGQLALARARIEAFGITDPAKQFDELLKVLVQNVEGFLLKATLGGLTVESIGGFLQNVLAQIEAGTFDFSRLGEDISADEFIQFLLELRRLSDSALDASTELSGLASGIRNAPSGFKVAFRRFTAATGTPIGTTGTRSDGPQVMTPSKDDPIPRIPGGGPRTINVAGDIIVVANDVDEMTTQIEERARRRARRGGVTSGQIAFQTQDIIDRRRAF